MNLVSPANKPVYVMADKKRIFEVISNLVGNAIKYGKKGGNVNVAFYDMDLSTEVGIITLNTFLSVTLRIMRVEFTRR